MGSTLSSACQPQTRAHPPLFPCLVVVFLDWMEITGSQDNGNSIWVEKNNGWAIIFTNDANFAPEFCRSEGPPPSESGVPTARPTTSVTLEPSSKPTTLEPTAKPTLLEPTPPTCTICDDRETSWQIRNGVDCAADTVRMDKKCNKDAKCTEKGFCRLSCYKAGNGYPGDVCCDEELQNRKNLRGR